MQRHQRRCLSPAGSDDDPLASDLFGAGAGQTWADEPEAEDGPEDDWGGSPLPISAEGPRYASDGELVMLTFNVNGGLTGLSTAASAEPAARDGTTSKLAQILEYWHARGAHVIALQEVRLTEQDVAVMDRDGRFGTYRPMLCAAGGRRSPCGVPLLLDRQLDRAVQSRDDISNGRYAGALVADADASLWAIYVAYGHSGAWMGGAALDDNECTFAHLAHSMAAMRARGARCILLGNLNIVRSTEDVLASSKPHAGGLELFASICVAGHVRDAMPPELAGTGVFTNRCGAGRLLPTESLAALWFVRQAGLYSGSAGLDGHRVARPQHSRPLLRHPQSGPSHNPVPPPEGQRCQAVCGEGQCGRRPRPSVSVSRLALWCGPAQSDGRVLRPVGVTGPRDRRYHRAPLPGRGGPAVDGGSAPASDGARRACPQVQRLPP